MITLCRWLVFVQLNWHIYTKHLYIEYTVLFLRFYHVLVIPLNRCGVEYKVYCANYKGNNIFKSKWKTIHRLLVQYMIEDYIYKILRKYEYTKIKGKNIKRSKMCVHTCCLKKAKLSIYILTTTRYKLISFIRKTHNNYLSERVGSARTVSNM